MKRFRLSIGLYAGLLFILVACQPIRPPTTGPAAQPTPAPTMASSPAAKQVVGKIMATIPVGNAPGDVVAIGNGTVWVPNVGDGTVSRIEAKTNEVVATIPIGTKGITGTYGSPWAVALGAGSLWVTDNAGHAIVRLDPTTNKVIATIPLEVEPFSLSATDGAVWVSALDQDLVVRIDPQTNRVVATIKVPSPCNFAFSANTVWVTNLRAGTVTRIDTQTNTVTATIDTPGPGPEGERPEMVVVGAEGVYVIDKRARTISLIDPATNQVILTKPSGGFVAVAAVGAEGVWAPDSEGGKLRLLDPKTLDLIGELALPDAFAVTLGEGSVWAVAGRAVVRVAPSATVAEQKPVGALTTFSSKIFELPMRVSFGPEWVVFDDYPGEVSLRGHEVDLAFMTTKQAKIAGPEASSKAPFVMVSFPDDFVTWIQAHGLFQVVKTQPVIVGGFQGIQINTIVTPACTNDRVWLLPLAIGWRCGTAGDPIRFIYLADVYGARVLIFTEGQRSEEDFMLGGKAAQKVLDTVVFFKP